MYEMEEGFRDVDSLMSRSSSDLDGDEEEDIYEPVPLSPPVRLVHRANCFSHLDLHGKNT